MLKKLILVPIQVQPIISNSIFLIIFFINFLLNKLYYLILIILIYCKYINNKYINFLNINILN